MASWRRSRASDEELAAQLRSRAWSLRGESSDYAPLLDAIGESKIVLLGAATEGTHEFNRERMALTQRLVVQKGFRVIAVDAGWSDAYRVNRFIHGVGFDEDAEGSLSDFKRFPSWCWRNADALDFVSWLRQYNAGVLRAEKRVSFLGLDLYNLRASMALVCRWLLARDADAARRACRQFQGFDQFGPDARSFVRAPGLGLSRAAERELSAELLNLHRRGLVRHAILNNDDGFLIEESTRLIEESEAYYGRLLRGGADAWNSYERHIAQTVEALADRFESAGAGAKMAIWSLNSHAGDASSVLGSGRKRTSLGRLLRERLGEDVFSIGSFTHEGTMTAALDWDAPPDYVRLRPAAQGSIERLFHLAGVGDFLLVLRGDEAASRLLRGRRLQRTVGMVYRPEAELASHWFEAELPRQFDAVLHFDRTRAVELIEAAPALSR